MSAPSIVLCVHGMNPRMCPPCHNAKPAVKSVPITAGAVVPLDEAKRRHDELLALGQERLVQSQAAQAQKAAEAAKAGQAPPATRALVPYSSAGEDAGSYSPDGTWLPPERGDVLSRLKRHPHADQAPTVVLNAAPAAPGKLPDVK